MGMPGSCLPGVPFLYPRPDMVEAGRAACVLLSFRAGMMRAALRFYKGNIFAGYVGNAGDF